jgi:hypothetical protein
MKRMASNRWFGTVLCCTALVGCSQAADTQITRAGAPTATKTAADTKAEQKPSTVAPSSSETPSAAPSTQDVLVKDQSKLMLDAGSDAAAAMPDANVSADGCEIGKFCPPQTPDPDNCGKLELKTDTKTVLRPGNVLVVYDRSTSMTADWNGTPKYIAATDALVAALTPLKDQLTVGGVFFPSVGGDDMTCPMGCNVADPTHWIPGPQACCLNTVANACTVTTIDQPDQLDFMPGDAFITGLPMRSQMGLGNGTPLGAGIARAAEALAGRMFTDPLVVLVMTDGEPNCMTDPQMVLSQVTTWQQNNIPTYVVGLPGAQMAADLLNQVAAAGGTDTYIDPANAQDLETRLRNVISSTVRAGFDSCTFSLDPKADAPEKLHLIVTQAGTESDIPRDWSKNATWKINAEGNQVDLEGQLCDMAKEGKFEGLRFVFGCVDVPPADPPPEPMLN